MNKSILFLIVFSSFIISGCNSGEEVQEKTKAGTVADTSIDKKQIEADFVTKTDKYLYGILGYIDEMDKILNDKDHVETGMNSLSLTTSELFSSNNEQRDSDSEFVLKGDIESYVKYEMTNKKIYEIQDIIFTISQDINQAAMDYDEALIVKTRGNIAKLKNLTNEAIEQLQSDRIQ